MRIEYVLTPRDVLFFRDARPMDSRRSMVANLRLIGHGAEWPRPDLLFSAVIHALLGAPEAAETDYGSVPDLRTIGPFPMNEGRLFLPMPLEWDMTLRGVPKGTTNLPSPLDYGFLDRKVGKKTWPAWISEADYARYLLGETGGDPERVTLWEVEPRVGTALDPRTGTARRGTGEMSDRWQMEVLRLCPGTSMVCAVNQARADALDGCDVRFGGQGGTARFRRVAEGEALLARLRALPMGVPSRTVRWTLLTPARFARGWDPDWLDEQGRVMLSQAPTPARREGESHKAWQERKRAAFVPFATARLRAARIGKPVAFSGWDTKTGEKPTSLAVPQGSAYVFSCETIAEARRLAEALHLVARSDLGQKGFGLGVCSFLKDNL